MEDQTPAAASLALVGAPPSSASKCAEAVRAALATSYSVPESVKEMEALLVAAARKSAVGDGLDKRMYFGVAAAQVAAAHSDLMASVARAGKFAQRAGESGRLSKHVIGGSFAELSRQAMGHHIKIRELAAASSLGAAVAKAASGSAFAESERKYGSLIKEPHRQRVRMEEASQSFSSASQLAKGFPVPDVYKGVSGSLMPGITSVDSLIGSVGLPGNAVVRPRVPSPRRPGQRGDAPVCVIDDLVVVDRPPLHLPGPPPVRYSDRVWSGLQLERRRLDYALGNVELDPLNVITCCARVVEATCKVVLRMMGSPASGRVAFNRLLYLAARVLGVHPENPSGGPVVREAVGTLLEVPKQIWKLRNAVKGSGAHGSDEVELVLQPLDAILLARQTIAWQETMIERSTLLMR